MESNSALHITSDPIPRLIAKIAIPASVGYFFNTMYNLVDTYYGGRISTEGLAALSMSFPVFILILAIGFGVSSGAGALISNAIGAGEEEKAKRYHSQALTFAFLLSLVSAAILFVLLPTIFRLFGADGETLKSALRYSRILVAGSMFFVLNYTLNAGLTARGDTKGFRNVLIVGFFLNVGLDPVFLYGLRLGGITLIPPMYEAGIALATILIQVFSFLYLLRRVRKKQILKGMTKADFIPDRATLREVVTQSAPTTLSMMTMALGTFVITFYVSRYGTQAVAAYGAALRIEQVALIPTMGLNVALATLVGQNNGAERLDRVGQAFKVTLIAAALVMVGVLTPILIFARPLMRLFTTEPMVVTIGVAYLFVEAITFYSYIVLNLSNSVLQGLKKPAMIMWVSVYRQIPAPLVVFTLLVFVMGSPVVGIWWGIAVVNWSAALFMLFFALRTLGRRRAEAPTAVAPEAFPVLTS